MVPAGDFIVGLEPIPQGDKFYTCPDDMQLQYHPLGLVLRPPCAPADARTWESIIGMNWHRLSVAEKCWPLYESALSVEVEPAPGPPAGR